MKISVFRVCILSSIALHMLIFLPLMNRSTAEIKVAATSQTLQFTLLEKNHQLSTPTTVKTVTAVNKNMPSTDKGMGKPHKNTAHISEKGTQARPKNSFVRTITPSPIVTTNQQPKKKATHSPETLPLLSSTQLSALIKQAINPYFYYPKLAIRKNWQGSVQLALRINPQGKINQVRIFKSSGYRILDLAALKSMRKITAIPLTGLRLPADYIDETHTIKYRLIDS